MVGLGSCCGGMLRYVVALAMGKGGAFPWPTLIVNLAGCLIIGLLYGLLDRGFAMPTALKLFLTVGFCGGFTTFSTFVNENYLLFGGGSVLPVIVYSLVSLAGGFLLLYAGYFLTRL